MTAKIGVRPAIYVIEGCPGSGKGTFAQTIKKEGYVHLSTGDIMRHELEQNTEIGLKYNKEILNHDPMPLAVINTVVEQRLKAALKENKGIILDGYPRFLEQCEFLDYFLEENNLKGKTVFLYIEIDPETAIERIAYRQTCRKCNEVYNLKFSPPKIEGECDVCHEKLGKRVDDDVEVTKKRVYAFKEALKDVLHYYSSADRLRVLDGKSQPGTFLDFHRSQVLQ